MHYYIGHPPPPPKIYTRLSHTTAQLLLCIGLLLRDAEITVNTDTIVPFAMCMHILTFFEHYSVS